MKIHSTIPHKSWSSRFVLWPALFLQVPLHEHYFSHPLSIILYFCAVALGEAETQYSYSWPKFLTLVGDNVALNVEHVSTILSEKPF